MKAWKLSRKASGQTPLMFTDCYFSLVSLRTLEDLAVGNLAEAAAELVKIMKAAGTENYPGRLF